MARKPKRRLQSGHLKAASIQCDAVRERVRKVRQERGLTTYEVAKQLKLSRPFYTQLEGGTRRMDLVYFLAICRVLKVNPGKLLK